MKKTPTPKPLRLRSETVRILQDAQLAAARGGLPHSGVPDFCASFENACRTETCNAGSACGCTNDYQR